MKGSFGGDLRGGAGDGGGGKAMIWAVAVMF
jgi:hypothetical protein